MPLYPRHGCRAELCAPSVASLLGRLAVFGLATAVLTGSSPHAVGQIPAPFAPFCRLGSAAYRALPLVELPPLPLCRFLGGEKQWVCVRMHVRVVRVSVSVPVWAPATLTRAVCPRIGCPPRGLLQHLRGLPSLPRAWLGADPRRGTCSQFASRVPCHPVALRCVKPPPLPRISPCRH